MPVVGSHAAARACTRGQRRAVRVGQLTRQRLARLVSAAPLGLQPRDRRRVLARAAPQRLQRPNRLVKRD